MPSECMPFLTLIRVQVSPSSRLIMMPWPTVPTSIDPALAMTHLQSGVGPKTIHPGGNACCPHFFWRRCPGRGRSREEATGSEPVATEQTSQIEPGPRGFQLPDDTRPALGIPAHVGSQLARRARLGL